jgi:hypothetical protein
VPFRIFVRSVSPVVTSAAAVVASMDGSVSTQTYVGVVRTPTMPALS